MLKKVLATHGLCVFPWNRLTVSRVNRDTGMYHSEPTLMVMVEDMSFVFLEIVSPPEKVVLRMVLGVDTHDYVVILDMPGRVVCGSPEEHYRKGPQWPQV